MQARKAFKSFTAYPQTIHLNSRGKQRRVLHLLFHNDDLRGFSYYVHVRAYKKRTLGMQLYTYASKRLSDKKINTFTTLRSIFIM